MVSKFILYMAVFFLTGFVGCATAPKDVPEVVSEYPETPRAGVYHKVKPGESLWRIAKAYDISIQDIIESNNIPDVAKIEKDQLIFIPGADAVRKVDLDNKASESEFGWPVEGKIIKYFGDRRGGKPNKGIDIKTKEGAAVKASRKGLVVFADDLAGYGKTVILDHQDGFYSVYSRNAKIVVKLGEIVSKSTLISYVGSKKDMAYLHFEIRKNSIEANPLYYLP